MAVIAAYLTFFPVTINTLRGPAVGRPARARADAVLCRQPLEGALEAARPGVAALRLLRLEDRRDRLRGRRDHRRAPSSIQDGLGGAILNFNQYYSLVPQNLWATNLVAAPLGIMFFLVVLLAEKLVVHRDVAERDRHRSTRSSRSTT